MLNAFTKNGWQSRVLTGCSSATVLAVSSVESRSALFGCELLKGSKQCSLSGAMFSNCSKKVCS